MNKREKLLLEAVKAGVLGLSELSNNQMLVDDSLDDIIKLSSAFSLK